jgi:hypothetical protein
MKTLSRLRPSPALAIAVLALFVALGGVSYSAVANSIGSRAIKNNSVRSVDVHKDTLTGADITESTLDTVPRAGTALLAGTAQTVGGLKLVKVKHRSGDVKNASILNAGGLQLLISCAGGDESITARTTVAGGEITVISDDADADDGQTNLIAHNADTDFKPGDVFDVRNIVTAADQRIYELHYLGGDGTDVTAHLTTQGNLGANVCVASGYAVVG